MPQFPKTETDIVTLASAVVAGCTTHPGMFPSVKVAALTAALAAYNDARHDQLAKMSAAQMATAFKEKQLDALTALLVNQIKLAEVDSSATPTQLTCLGWGPKQPYGAAKAPGQPRDFQVVAQEATNVTLKWKSPARGEGGTVRSYIIERRDEPPGGGAFGPWHQIATALTSPIRLEDQPSGIKMEYNVIAINTAGHGTRSSTAAVVL